MRADLRSCRRRLILSITLDLNGRIQHILTWVSVPINKCILPEIVVLPRDIPETMGENAWLRLRASVSVLHDKYKLDK